MISISSQLSLSSSGVFNTTLSAIHRYLSLNMKFFSTLMAVAGFASIVTAASNPDDFETDSVDKGTRSTFMFD